MEEPFEEVMDKAKELPYGDSKVALLEEAVRIADAHLSSEEQFDARLELTEAAVMSGRVEKGIVSFAWCLAHFEPSKHPYSHYTLIWQYKWICDHIKGFPEVSREKIEEMLADYKRRLEEAGYQLRSYYKLQRAWADHRGDQEQAAYYFDKWQEARDDGMTDCTACEISGEVSYWIDHGQFERAYQKAQPLIKGELSCHSVPQVTYGKLLLPLLEQGRREEAATYYQRCYKGIKGKVDFFTVAADLIQYLVVVDVEKAVAIFEEFVDEADQSRVPLNRFYFYKAGSILFHYLSPKQQRLVRLPDGLTPQRIDEEVEQRAAQFDRRNGSTHFADRLKKLRQRIAKLRDE